MSKEEIDKETDRLTEDHQRPIYHGWENMSERFVIMTETMNEWMESDTWVDVER